MLPENTADVIRFLLPNVPLKNYTVKRTWDAVANAKVTTLAWRDAVAQPSEAAINAAAVSAEFATWLADRTDPAKNVKRLAREWLQSNEPLAVAMRAVISELGASLREVRTAQGKPNRTDQQFLGDVISKHLQ